MGWMGGATAAAIAAAAKKKRDEEEEESLVQYAYEDLDDGWEFKIVRSMGYSFGNRATLERLIEEEAQAGWEFLEKFDDSRVRFKRPASARQYDHLLPADVNPYRTEYGMGATVIVAIVVGVVLMLVVFGVLMMVVAG